MGKLNKSPLLSRYPRTILVVLMAMVMTACGFHLRGLAPIPESLRSLWLNSESGQADFDRNLITALQNAEVTLIPEESVDDNTLELRVQKIEVSDSVLARASDNDVTAITRTVKAYYIIRAKDGKALYGPRLVSVNQSIYNQDASTDVVDALNKSVLSSMLQNLAKNLVSDLAYAPL